jgi:hypothetical protein
MFTYWLGYGKTGENQRDGRIFFASFVSNLEPRQCRPSNTIGIYCTPVYHEQAVEATVDAMTHAPINVKRLGTITPISMTLFNTALLHFTLSAGNWQNQTRSDVLPLDTLSKLLDNDATTNFTALGMPTLAMALIA